MPVDYANLAKVLAGLAGAGFIGYCIYFDHKRRTDPTFKTKLKKKRESAESGNTGRGGGGLVGLDLPDMKDQEAVQKFFLEEVQRGQDCLHENNKEACVKHLTNAISVSGQPQQLLNIFKQTLPPDVFQMLIQNLAMLGSAQMAQMQQQQKLKQQLGLLQKRL